MNAHVVCGAEIANDVVRRVVTRTLLEVDEEAARLEEIVHETIYCEEQRLARGPADPRSETDHAWIAALRRDLTRADEAGRREILHRVVDRYAREISGRFDARVHRFATRVLPVGLSTALHGDLDDRLRIEGEIGMLRALAREGTVVLAPSHVSNLDSVILGWALDRLGLPPFAYGAGLNLFSNAVIGFFMRNLGAYTVDRKKTDPLYRETLKEYGTVLLERGQHSLFFPGGTRSRSGRIERRLKLGLLGTAPVALRHALETGTKRRLFVVPCTLTYPLVLEASSLVEDYLRAEGGAHYIDLEDEFDRPRRWIDFVRGLLALDLVVHVRFGRPIDPVGNDVDEDGESLDPHGRRVDVKRYFTVDGELAADAARDAEYTRMVSSRLVDAYRRDTVAVPTSVLAAVVFERLRREHAQPDLFRLLRSIPPETTLPLHDVYADVARACTALEVLDERGAVHVADDLRCAAPLLVERALGTFATYHAHPVVERRGDRLAVGDPKLLFFYRNRLEGVVS